MNSVKPTKASTPQLVAVVMAGGVGERFWPASRREKPKPFMEIGEGGSLIRRTLDRTQGLIPPERFVIITNRELEEAFHEALPEIPRENILGEPCGRNTAPCVAWGASIVRERWGDEAVMAILSADHHIRDIPRFQAVLAAGAALAARDRVLVTMGIVPDRPDTGFGYIRTGEEIKLPEDVRARRALEFVEKPDPETARQYVATGNYVWNSGMFLWSVRAIQEAIRQHMPELAEGIARIEQATGEDARAVLDEVYPTLTKTPIDKGVMEKADNVVTLDGDFGWDDVGTWPALARVEGEDANGNTILGEHVGLETKGTIVYADEGIVATFGVEDLVIVRHGNAVLVCPRDKAPDLKKLVAEVAKREDSGDLL